MGRQTLTRRNVYRLETGAPDLPACNEPAPEWTRSDAGWITGRTIDETGNPLPFAHIRIHLYDFSTISDASGFFILACIPEGEYMIIVEHEAFGLQFVPSVRVGIGGTSLETVQMEDRILPYHEYQEYRE